MNRITTLLTLVFFLFILLFACQKAISVEQISNGAANGSLKDSSGDCMTDPVTGTFYNGVPLYGDTCFVQLKVNIMDTGSYIIYTDSVNGFAFSDTGYFKEKGGFIIKLKAVGRPRVPDSTNFAVHFNNDSCFFTVPVKDSTGIGSREPPKEAKGNIKDSSENCFPIEVIGQYYKDLPLVNSNSIKIKVNITSTGNFKIATDTVNGIFFRTELGIIERGTYVLSLRGYGTPKHIERSNFLLKLNGSSCPFSVNVKDSSERIVLKPTVIEPTENMCMNAKVNGNYTIHQSLNNDNSISLSVNVTNLGNGNYYITEGWINGLWFGNAGTFHSSGIQDITLHSGNGAPTRTGITNFPITLSSGSNNTKCTIPIYVNDNPNLYDTGRNTWSFRAGDKTYHGFITSIENEPSGGNPSLLAFNGTDAYEEADTLIHFAIQFPENSKQIIPGTYKTDPQLTSQNEFYFKQANEQSAIYTTRNSSADHTTGLTLIITSYNADTNKAYGTFSGQVFTNSGDVVNINEGKFIVSL